MNLKMINEKELAENIEWVFTASPVKCLKEKAQSAFKTGVVTSALQDLQKTRSAFKTATERSALQVSKLIITQKLKEINEKKEKK